ncbi:MAG TPA: lytic murein transglycosylase, partial [Stellaceae bacterium]|nr:lytic murein transglycosylase [Stellaceae bacterium]
SSAAIAAETDFATWLQGVRADAVAKGMRPEAVDRALQDAHEIPRVIELDRNQPETTITFKQYIDRIVTPQRIAAGRQKMAENSALLEAVSHRFNVQPRFIVALWAIESNYGSATGDYPVISALATLAYDGRRSTFFRKELMAAIEIVDRGYMDPDRMKGSWAGAMGQCQFMPSSYLKLAVSYSGDGRRDIWQRRDDVFASIANYLASFGWHADETWGRQVRLPQKFDASLAGLATRKTLAEWGRLGVRRADGGPLPKRDLTGSIVLPGGPDGPAVLAYDNYRALLRWNNSNYFATAVGYLADGFE